MVPAAEYWLTNIHSFKPGWVLIGKCLVIVAQIPCFGWLLGHFERNGMFPVASVGYIRSYQHREKKYILKGQKTRKKVVASLPSHVSFLPVIKSLFTIFLLSVVHCPSVSLASLEAQWCEVVLEVKKSLYRW